MSIGQRLRHWLIPHHSNNFRAKLLHNSGIFAIIGIVVVGNIFIRLLDNPALHILGFTSSVAVDEVVRATNEQRIGLGLKPLSYNEKLADAARRKAANMFEENYWAHNSPSGKSPWVWFKSAGYSYIFAGENLAKDFGDTSRLMSAWMASPTHKDNIVNSKYTEIGVAVVPGSLQNSDTVLVVQFFGTPGGGSVASAKAPEKPAPVQIAQIKEESTIPVEITPTPIASPPPVISSEVEKTISEYNSFSLARSLNLATTALFILALILDLIIAQNQKLSRRVGNNWAHILFINLILLATTIVNAGKIL